MVTAGRPAPPGGPYLVAGLGRAGQAALGALGRTGTASRRAAWDEAETPPVLAIARRWRRRGIEVAVGGDGIASLEALGPQATIVKSPGIDPDVPLLRHARVRGDAVLDELELGWRLSRRPIVGVTGTNGKSTTCALVRGILERAHQGGELVGNAEGGSPLSAAAGDGWLVCEVSSFQLEACESFLPEVAVFTNLTPEHLSRHGTMERYGDAKRLMFVREEEPRAPR